MYLKYTVCTKIGVNRIVVGGFLGLYKSEFKMDLSSFREKKYAKIYIVYQKTLKQAFKTRFWYKKTL